jgi:hypothetical protein
MNSTNDGLKNVLTFISMKSERLQISVWLRFAVTEVSGETYAIHLQLPEE